MIMDAADKLVVGVPAMHDDRFRVNMTIGCRDCDRIPKVANAGEVIEENGQRLQVMHNGIRVLADAYLGPYTTEIVSGLNGHHEPQEELVFFQVLDALKPDATMLEIGGYWSYYSLWFLLQHQNKRQAFVIEPDPQHLNVGRINAKLNKREICFINACVGNQSQRVQKWKVDDGSFVKIPKIAVPDFFRQQNLETLDILHCDAQGCEVGVIRSCKELLKAGKIKFCFFSTHSHVISSDPLTHQRCVALLEDYGGRILAEHDVHESFSGDGLVVAYFGRDPLDWKPLSLSLNRYSKSFFRNPLYDLENELRFKSIVKRYLRKFGVTGSVKSILKLIRG
jgi:FkbM family methyltransferase